VATQLADSPPEQQPPEAAAAPDAPPVAPPEPDVRSCAKCGAALAPGQDWCLQCGTGAPGSVGSGGWRPLLTVLAATAVLVLGAAAAGYAALSKKTRTPPTRTMTVAQVTPPAVTTPAPALSTPTTSTPLPGLTTKPPKIPLKAATPPAASTPAVTPAPTKTTTPGGSQTGSNSGGANAGEGNQPEALVLDTNAAATYNPYEYSAGWFGDPSLAIDGDTTTGWTAQVNPATAPNLAEGLLLDLKSSRKLSAVKLVTSTPGLTVQVYGSQAKTVPASITDPAWVPLSRSIDVKKRHARIALRNKKKAYRFVTIWISKAPQSALGTPEAPGKVVLDEIELIPAG
jgi:hypothetical protein